MRCSRCLIYDSKSVRQLCQQSLQIRKKPNDALVI